MRFQTLAALAGAGLVSAQTFTDCDPTKKTCPADTALDSTTFSSDFTQGSSAASSWSLADGTTLTYGSKGAEFSISNANQAPTISTDFYFFFGTIEVKMQAAPGTGIVSSIVLESDDLDEIDLEFLGGDTTQVETNYFGKGNTTTYDRAIYYPVSSPQTTMHTYTVDWSSSAIVFSVDGTVVRTLNYDDANGGSNFPQTPMRLKLGNWPGGAPQEAAGTVEWAGGACDFTKGPFVMYVESVKITNANPGKEYVYGDETGSWQSIKIVNDNGDSESSTGNSTATGSATTLSSAAPTSSLSVSKLQQTAAAVSKTISGTAGATGTAGAAYGSKNSTGIYGTGASTMKTATATGTGSSSLSTSGAYGNGTSSTGSSSSSGSSSGSSASSGSSSGSSASSSSPAQQTTSGASVNMATSALFTVFTVAMCAWML